MNKEQELMRDFMYYVKRKRQAEKRNEKTTAIYWYRKQLEADKQLKELDGGK